MNSGHTGAPMGGVYRTNAAGGYEPAEPLGWLEEHNWLQRLVLAATGRGHCGKSGWRTGVRY